MADINEFVKKSVATLIKEEYPHLKGPPAALARIVQSEKMPAGYRYVLKLLDVNMAEDEDIPQIPSVMSDVEYSTGDIVCVVMLYGQLRPVVVGRYIA